MTIKIIDKRTGEELSTEKFWISITKDNHLIWGWKTYDHLLAPGEVNTDFYEVTFPEMEELKDHILDLQDTKRFHMQQLEEMKQCIAELEKKVNSFTNA